MPKDIAIYYATMTGNSELVAQRAHDAAKAAGWNSTLHNLCDAKPDELASNAQIALFVVSTWGDGEPPSDAEDFFGALGTETPDLSAMRYAVFGLGDSDYELFNGFARNLDQRLSELGGKTYMARVEADREFDDTYAQWEPTFIEAINGLA
ncbi:MAG: flavodoxin-like domain-containing protein [Puniceicoccales bacterium]|jgi:sulfite reductase (NADPH) flavoprotein alpha-component|nr:flavodoxin-like domain-containing protein [Puniceicoccales bacterium]